MTVVIENRFSFIDFSDYRLTWEYWSEDQVLRQGTWKGEPLKAGEKREWRLELSETEISDSKMRGVTFKLLSAKKSPWWKKGDEV
jgi:hypothetical protein